MNENKLHIDEVILLQYLQGTLDEESRSSVETWLSAETRNRKNLDGLESLWLESGKLIPVPVAVDVDAAWKKMSDRIDRHEPARFPVSAERTLKGYSRLLFAAAAMVVVLLGIFSVYHFMFNTGNQFELASRDMVVHDTLPDGSKVTLNRNSKLFVGGEFNEGTREVILTGEAYFIVRHDAAKPFIVDAGGAKIRVLGTSFSVKNNPDGGGEVIVSEGRVMLFKPGARTGDTLLIILEAGESGIWQPGGAKPVMTGSATPDGHFWADRTLDFRNKKLSEVFTLLEKYYPVNITVSDPAVMNCRLTALFVDEPPDRILAVIAESFDLKLEAGGQNFHLTGQGCTNEGN